MPSYRTRPAELTTWHVYKTDCFGSSRVMLQAQWDEEASFIHLPARDKNGQRHTNSRSQHLSFATLARILLERTVGSRRVFVFHAQPSLPYLFFTQVLLCFKPDVKTRLVYDIHDLHEPPQSPTLWHKIRYGLLRQGVLGLLERWACRQAQISKITVSRGLAETIALSYHSAVPQVIRSAPPPAKTAMELSMNSREERTLLFFGTSERVPLGLFDALAEAKIKLHIYGRGITQKTLEAALGKNLPDQVSVLGPYDPADISFVQNYRYLVLYQPDDTSLNFRYSLPNKFFQSISHGTSLIVSSNFQEIIETLNRLPGALAQLNSPSGLQVAMTALDAERTGSFWESVVQLAGGLHFEARESYRSVIGIGSSPSYPKSVNNYQHGRKQSSPGRNPKFLA